MKKNTQNQKEAFFIVRNLYGKFSHDIDTYLIGPFYSRLEAREHLIALHERTIKQQDDDIENIFLGKNGEYSKVETHCVTFSFQILNPFYL